MNSCSMEIDDIETDPIKDFLLNKLNSMREENKLLKEKIEQKTELLNSIKNEKETNIAVKIEKSWTRINNGLYVYALCLRNEETLPVRLENILLNWNSSTLITYNVSIFNLNENDFDRSSDTIEKRSLIAVVIEKPNFFKQSEFVVDGILVYTVAKDKYQIPLPSFSILCDDYYDKCSEINFERLLEGDIDEIIALYSSNQHFELSTTIEGSNNVRYHFGVLCKLKCVDLNKKTLFLASGISSAIDGILLEILDQKDTFKIKIICKNDDVLFDMLRYLYKNIKGISVTPSSINSGDKSVSKFSDLLHTEISLIENLYKTELDENETTKKLRKELNYVQYQTDQLYTQLNLE